MTNEMIDKTFGEGFLLAVEKSQNQQKLFAVLEDAVSQFYPQYDLSAQLVRLSDFESVAIYQNKLARIRIDYNAKAVREIYQRLIGLKNFGNDNYKYKEKIIRKLNLLINNYPTIDEIIYIVMAAYVMCGYGNVKKFKKELCAYINENSATNLHNQSIFEKVHALNP